MDLLTPCLSARLQLLCCETQTLRSGAPATLSSREACHADH